MRRWLASLLCLAAGGVCLAYPAAPIDGDAARADIALTRRVLEVVHPGYDRYTPRAEMDAAFAALEADAAGGTTDAALYLGLSRVLERIRCDHTKAEAPDALRAWREAHPSFLPVRTHIFADRLFAGTSRVPGLARGEEILSINGVPAARLIREVEALIPIDGATDHARAGEAELSDEFLGSGLDTFMPLLHGWSSEFTLVVRDAGGNERTLAAPALTLGAFREMVGEGERYASDFADGVLLERPNAATAVLTVSTFINYRRPVDPDSVFGPIMRRLNEEGVERLIVDLRSNGGGSDDAPESLFRHLIRSPVRVTTGGEVQTVPIPADVKAAVTTWDMSALEAEPGMFERAPSGRWAMPGGQRLVEPAADHFRGRVIVLCGRDNASGSTMLISALQHHAGAVVVGEPTGGSVEGPTAGLILFCRLPASGITVRVPAVRSYTGIAPAAPGMGVVPDVAVTRTPEGLFGGRDEAMEAALGL